MGGGAIQKTYPMQEGLDIPCRLVFEGEARSERDYYINLIRAVIIQISKYS